MSHRRYFAELSMKFSQDAIDYMNNLAKLPLEKRLPEHLSKKDIADLQAICKQLAASNTWMQEFTRDLMAENKNLTTQNELLAADIIRLRAMLREYEER